MGLVEDLSAAFVAFTIEADDTAEARLSHRTTRQDGRGGGREKGVWLASLAMWENCLRWLPADGMTVAELAATARTHTNLDGMRRWGYVEIEGLPRGAKGKPKLGSVLRPTRRGTRAALTWAAMPAAVEARWRERFGNDRLAALREALVGLAAELDPGLPDTMPIVRHGFSTRRRDEPAQRPGPVAVADLGLDSLLARPLTAFALAYEAETRLPLAHRANLLEPLGAEPIAIRHLPELTGIAREQIDVGLRFATKHGLVEIGPDPAAKRGKAVVLAGRGEKARAAGRRREAELEAAWAERHGEALAAVREALAPLAAGGGPDSPLLTGLEHPPGGWRAEAKPPGRLPRFPLVTHRGGYPDGA